MAAAWELISTKVQVAITTHNYLLPFLKVNEGNMPSKTVLLKAPQSPEVSKLGVLKARDGQLPFKTFLTSRLCAASEHEIDHLK